jgi:hypothetical protein
VRAVVFTIALVFIAAIGIGTVLDIQRNGFSAIDVIGGLLFLLIMIGVVGAMGSGPRQ